MWSFKNHLLIQVKTITKALHMVIYQHSPAECLRPWLLTQLSCFSTLNVNIFCVNFAVWFQELLVCFYNNMLSSWPKDVRIPSQRHELNKHSSYSIWNVLRTHTLHFFTICQQLTKVFAMDFWVKHCHLNYTIFSHRPCTVLGMHFKLNIRYITPVFEFFYYRFTHSFIRLWTTDHWTWLSRQFQPICLIQCTGNLYPQNRLAP